MAEVRTGQKLPLAEVGVSSGRSIRSVPVIVPKSSANIIATGTARCVRAPHGVQVSWAWDRVAVRRPSTYGR